MILEKIKDYVANNVSTNELKIKGIWGIDFILQSQENERTIDMKYFVVQTVGQGCAFADGKLNLDYNKRYLNCNYLDLEIDDVALDIAVLDSILYNNRTKAKEIVTAEGNPSEKAQKRAEIVVEEVLKLANGERNLKVVNVGVIGLFIEKLTDLGFDVVGTDFDEEIIGKRMFGKTEVVNGIHTLEKIKEADIAIVTGMALTTNTIDSIMDVARKSNTKLIIYAQTGANFGQFFIDEGVDTFIGEEFPIYGIQGRSNYNIYRK